MYAALRRFRADHVFNPWSDVDALDVSPQPGAQRLARLRRHFDCDPTFVLVGEASGYQGCHASGIPFTSERLLLQGSVPRVAVPCRLTSRPRPWSEPSASIVWGTLQALGIAERVVLWNAFPWHPHRPGAPYSNRRPTHTELQQGVASLKAVLARFEHAVVIAVGQIAHQALVPLVGSDVPLLRHPAYGGARAFSSGLTALTRARGRRMAPAHPSR
ncbi:MAG: uracil-DNA glycosylase [Steroidobacteraceae bacterium]